ncbi:hypothetical protein BDW66DRAFT_8331 [Aspergillus desertorum]
MGREGLRHGSEGLGQDLRRQPHGLSTTLRLRFTSGQLCPSVHARRNNCTHGPSIEINLEYSTDVLCVETGLPISVREARRRLMWGCFVTDALLGSGVDQLMLINERETSRYSCPAVSNTSSKKFHALRERSTVAF